MFATEVRPAIHFAAALCYPNSPSHPVDRHRRPFPTLRFTTSFRPFSSSSSSSPSPSSCAASSASPPSPPAVKGAVAADKKPVVCTADELYSVPVPRTQWRIAFWRYLPSPKTRPRNHPLMLLSGVGTNAIGFDLSPECSFARYMASQGFGTWIVEVRGAGLSTIVEESMEVEDTMNRDLAYQMIQSVEQHGADGRSSKPSQTILTANCRVLILHL